MFAAGDRARAKVLSNEGKKHKAEMERLHLEASEWIFKGGCDFREALHSTEVKDKLLTLYLELSSIENNLVHSSFLYLKRIRDRSFCSSACDLDRIVNLAR